MLGNRLRPWLDILLFLSWYSRSCSLRLNEKALSKRTGNVLLTVCCTSYLFSCVFSVLHPALIYWCYMLGSTNILVEQCQLYHNFFLMSFFNFCFNGFKISIKFCVFVSYRIFERIFFISYEHFLHTLKSNADGQKIEKTFISMSQNQIFNRQWHGGTKLLKSLYPTGQACGMQGSLIFIRTFCDGNCLKISTRG